MCPDDPTLSSFVDHELAPEASARVEAHVTGCDRCRSRLRRYQSLSHRLLECDEPDVEAAALRVWGRLDAPAPGAAARRRWWPWRWSPRRWSPLPIAAASAAAAIVLVFTLAPGDRPLPVAAWARLAVPGMADRTAATDQGPSDQGSPDQGSPDQGPSDQGPAVLELALPDAGDFRLFGAPDILREGERQPAAGPPGAPITMAVKLPPARYRQVGMPVIVHEGELATASR